MHIKIKHIALCLIIALNGYAAFAQNGEVTSVKAMLPFTELTKLDVFYLKRVLQDSEFECRPKGNETTFESNPLVLNGKALDFERFNMDSKGILTLVKGKPETADATPIPFFVSIRRHGQIITDEKMPFLHKELYDINLSDIFLFSKPGDMLIIRPARAEDWKAKRILKLFAGGC
jgi:hypothetical protein